MMTRKHRIKLWRSFQKERQWLENMALEGWFLENISLGICYSFVKGEPKRILYDIDRFNLPKKPTLEEILHKEIFLEMAQEMGWREVTHDESMTYYFAKEYEEDGINELHNDPESRRYRAEKFRMFLWEYGKKCSFWALIIAAVDLFCKLLQTALHEFFLGWYDWFTLLYVIFCCAMAVGSWRWGIRCQKELSMTRREWEESVDSRTHKKVKKLIFTTNKLKGFLQKQAQEGWILTGVTPIQYFFEKQDSVCQIYTMDSKWLVNKRRAILHQEKIADGKDWNGLNNDWQLQSVHDAEERGWTFVCALENRSVIYRGNPETVQPLNDERYDRKLRWISLIGEYGFYLLICGLVGGIAGFIIALLQYII